MTYTLTRMSTIPDSPLRILVDQPDLDSPGDGGFAAGGSFMFEPGDRVQVGEAAARAIMGDPGLAHHFTCEPPWRGGGGEHLMTGPSDGPGGQNDD